MCSQGSTDRAGELARRGEGGGGRGASLFLFKLYYTPPFLSLGSQTQFHLGMMMEKETLYHQKQMVIFFFFFFFLLLNRHTKELKKKLSLAKRTKIFWVSQMCQPRPLDFVSFIIKNEINGG